MLHYCSEINNYYKINKTEIESTAAIVKFIFLYLMQCLRICVNSPFLCKSLCKSPTSRRRRREIGRVSLYLVFLVLQLIKVGNFLWHYCGKNLTNFLKVISCHNYKSRQPYNEFTTLPL